MEALSTLTPPLHLRFLSLILSSFLSPGSLKTKIHFPNCSPLLHSRTILSIHLLLILLPTHPEKSQSWVNPTIHLLNPIPNTNREEQAFVHIGVTLLLRSPALPPALLGIASQCFLFPLNNMISNLLKLKR